MDFSKRQVKKSIKVILFWGILIIVCLLIVFPVYWMINTSLMREVELFCYPPKFLPSFDIKGYLKVFEAGNIFIWIKNSALVSISTVLLTVVCATLAAYSLSRFRFWTTPLFMLLIISTQIIPPALIIVPLYTIFASLRLSNTFRGLIIADVGIVLAFVTWILKGFFDEIPKELEEAALLDGCSRFGAFLRVTLPLASPAIISVAIITFFDTWNEYMFGLTLITSPEKWVGTVGIASFVGQIAVLWDQMLAGAALFCAVPLLFFFLLQRYIVRGLTAGALKI